MTELVTRNYWWLGVTKEVERYVDGCDACQRYKNQSKVLVGKLMPNYRKVSEFRGESGLRVLCVITFLYSNLCNSWSVF